jgi:hypothetical protein
VLFFCAEVGGYYYALGLWLWLCIFFKNYEVFNEAWRKYFLNADLVLKFLRSSTLGDAHSTLNAGYRWTGTGPPEDAYGQGVAEDCVQQPK